MITIELNKELDYEVYNDFRNFSIGGVDFGKIISIEHPLINAENYKKYIDQYYIAHDVDIGNSLYRVNYDLRDKQKPFDEFVSKIFGKRSVRKEYIGYLSIFNCNPRYLDKKTFQIFYKKGRLSMLEVCFHEVLHFQFFNYCNEYLKNETGALDKNSGKLWELSEIFNVIIMNQTELKIILGQEELLFYPDLREKLETAKIIWGESGQDIKKFIVSCLAKEI